MSLMPKLRAISERLSEMEGRLPRWARHCAILAVAVVSVEASAQTTGVQCAFRDVVGSFPSERVNDVAVVGHTAFITDHNAFRALDVSDPANPTEVGSIPVLGGPLTIRDGLAYVTAGGAGIHIVDISAPSSMAVVGAYDTPGSAFQVEIVDELAFVADHSAGLVILDISDPGNPTFVGQADSFDNPHSVQVVGDFAYCAIGYGGFQIIDIADPAAPEILHRIGLGYFAVDVTVVNDIAYVADSSEGLKTIDITDPTKPKLLGAFETSRYREIMGAASVEVIDGVAYVGALGVHILDVADPSAPVALGHYDLGGWIQRVELHGDLLYCADITEGLHVIDVSAPKPSSVIGHSDRGKPVGIDVGDGFIVTALEFSGIQIIDATDPSSLSRMIFYDTPGLTYDVQVEGSLVYAFDGTSLIIIDVSDPFSPVTLGAYENPGNAWYGEVVGDYAYYANDRDGLRIIDVSDPTNPTLVSTYETAGDAEYARAHGDLAFVSVGGKGVDILDVSDRSSPQLLGHYKGTRTFDVAEGLLVIWVSHSTGGGRLEIVDISDPSAPVKLSEFPLDGAQDIDIVGDRVFVCGAAIIDIADPASPRLVGQYRGGCRKARIADGVAYLARYERGTLVVDVSDCPPCLADCDGSGDLNFFDFLCYQNLFAAGDPGADCDGSGGLDFFDFLCFQNAFAAGCE